MNVNECERIVNELNGKRQREKERGFFLVVASRCSLCCFFRGSLWCSRLSEVPLSASQRRARGSRPDVGAEAAARGASAKEALSRRGSPHGIFHLRSMQRDIRWTKSRQIRKSNESNESKRTGPVRDTEEMSIVRIVRIVGIVGIVWDERWWKMVRPCAAWISMNFTRQCFNEDASSMIQWGCKSASRAFEMLVKSEVSKNKRNQFSISAFSTSSTSSTPSTCKIQTFNFVVFALHRISLH